MTSQFRMNSHLKNLKSKENNPWFNPWFIILLTPNFWLPEHKPSVYSSWDRYITLSTPLHSFSSFMTNESFTPLHRALHKGDFWHYLVQCPIFYCLFGVYYLKLIHFWKHGEKLTVCHEWERCIITHCKCFVCWNHRWMSAN